MSGATPAAEAVAAIRAGACDRAHAIVQARAGEAMCDLVHAHLHRREGDLANAAYWYRRAGRPVATDPLEDELESLRLRTTTG